MPNVLNWMMLPIDSMLLPEAIAYRGICILCRAIQVTNASTFERHSSQLIANSRTLDALSCLLVQSRHCQPVVCFHRPKSDARYREQPRLLQHRTHILTTMWCAYDGQVKDMVRLSAPSLARGCHQCINDIGHKVACVRPLHPSVLGVSPASEQRPHPDRGAPMMWSPHAVSSLVVAIPSIAKPLPIPQKHADHWTSTASRTHPLVLSATIMSAADPQKHCSVHTNASVIP